MPTLFRDYETRSTLNLRNVGAWKYAGDPTTDVWCCAYAVDDGPVGLWVPGDPVPAEFIEAAENPKWLISAFNDAFDRAIEQHVLSPRYGWPTIPIERHRCSQAAALALALPATLDGVARALDLPQQKDTVGRNTMLRMARPRKPRRDEDPAGIYWFDDIERRAQLYAYCKQDTATERAIAGRIGSLSPAEQDVWTLDASINARGIHLDTGLLSAAITIADAAQTSIAKEIARVTDGAVTSIDQVAALLTWLGAHGCEFPDVRKPTLEKALTRADLSTTARRVIELRLDGAHAVPDKISRRCRQQ